MHLNPTKAFHLLLSNLVLMFFVSWEDFSRKKGNFFLSLILTVCYIGGA